ncbi:hypothetical protein LINPERPRIM_LOCUS40872 [Linum perenne]
MLRYLRVFLLGDFRLLHVRTGVLRQLYARSGWTSSLQLELYLERH